MLFDRVVSSSGTPLLPGIAAISSPVWASGPACPGTRLSARRRTSRGPRMDDWSANLPVHRR